MGAGEGGRGKVPLPGSRVAHLRCVTEPHLVAAYHASVPDMECAHEQAGPPFPSLAAQHSVSAQTNVNHTHRQIAQLTWQCTATTFLSPADPPQSCRHNTRSPNRVEANHSTTCIEELGGRVAEVH
eukprot:3931888-Rhodomonas_salina.1